MKAFTNMFGRTNYREEIFTKNYDIAERNTTNEVEEKQGEDAFQGVLIFQRGQQ